VGVAGRVGGQVIVSAGPATVGGRATGRSTGSWPLSVRVGRTGLGDRANLLGSGKPWGGRPRRWRSGPRP